MKPIKMSGRVTFRIGNALLFISLIAGLTGAQSALADPAQCERNITADVVAFDQPLMYNRLGAQNINGAMYALRRDTVQMGNLDPLVAETEGLPEAAGGTLAPGQVALRADKRPRPLVLRVREGDCLVVNFQNLLAPTANPFHPVEERSGMEFKLKKNNQVAERVAGFHVTGMQLVNSIADDSSWVGQNANSMLRSGDATTYSLYAAKEGQFVINSYGVTFGGEGQGGNTAAGLIGEVIVEPKGSAIYRSQLTREEMDLATQDEDGQPVLTPLGQPIVNYEATYPEKAPWTTEGKAGLPILNMIQNNKIVHSEINAIVAYGPTGVIGTYQDGKPGHFPPDTYPLESVGKRNPTLPNRLEPFRDFASVWHDEAVTAQAFPKWFSDPVLSHTLHGVRDSFMINYGSGGIGSEIISNRLGVGPMYDCLNCAYEEFFLTSFTVGDPAMLVDVPANAGLELCDPALNNCTAVGPKATKALFPDDPANVHHAYTGDFTKFRNVHAGPAEQHIFHLHNHQWLFNPNDDNSNYLDAQGIGPGAGYTYEINFGGAGNRNKSSGDAIFHCHFYPHFAQGMWYMWRLHDVYEVGTELEVSGGGIHTTPFALVDGTPALHADAGAPGGLPADARTRSLPDGEITVGTPIPGVVPLPGKPMPLMPGNVAVIPTDVGGPLTPGVPDGNADSSQAKVVDRTINPGYPFWIAGIEHTVGQRPPTPQLDMITKAQAEKLVEDTRVADPDARIHDGFAAAADGWDGGLPRFTLGGYLSGGASHQVQTRFDFSKEILKAKPYFYPETGTDLEKVAMAFHAQRCHDTYYSDGDPATCWGPDWVGDGRSDWGGFILNGQPPVPGAPYHEPCQDDEGTLLSDDSKGYFFSAEGKTTQGTSLFDAANPRIYKAANVQFDAVFNKLGYHFPQQRIIALWQDVMPTIEQRKPPEPFVMRMNSFDCANFHHANLVPKSYELDDYQVRTPTDIIGQHIHLPKWDLTTTDGAANGWNYEDGTLAPEMVVEIIHAVKNYNEVATTPVVVDVEGNPVVDSAGNQLSPTSPLQPLPHPFFNSTNLELPDTLANRWLGARTTTQRWFTDPVVNVDGIDRGLGIIFTHDHYGPSTHQQVGLYATLLAQPAGSEWRHNETGVQLGQNPATGAPSPGRIDGGPTSWQAAILTRNDGKSAVGAGDLDDFREFYFEYSDFQHAYEKGVYVGVGADGEPIHKHPTAGITAAPTGLKDGTALASNETFRYAVQPPVRAAASNVFPDILQSLPECPGGVQRPCPEAITADDAGLYVVNYRNESLMARIFDPGKKGPDEKLGAQADLKAGDLAFAMQSRSDRAIPQLNDKLGDAPAGYAGDEFGEVFLPPINQLSALIGGDPFTPSPRAYAGDTVKIKMQAGGQEEEHASTIHGMKWLQGGSAFGKAGNSGWRSSQTSGISEQFTLNMPVVEDKTTAGSARDYAYSHNAGMDGWAMGTWGVMRNYGNGQNDLYTLPDNPKPNHLANTSDFNGACPTDARVVSYDITAVLANDVLPNPGDHVTLVKAGFEAGGRKHAGGPVNPDGGTLVYNDRTTSVGSHSGPLHDPTAILYVHTSDLVAKDVTDPDCLEMPKNGKGDPILDVKLPTCPVALAAGVAVEPVVIRANAGDCIDVTLRNKLLEPAVDADGDRVWQETKGKGRGQGRAPSELVFYPDEAVVAYFKDAAMSLEATLPVTFDQMPDLPNRNTLPLMIPRDRNLGSTTVGVEYFNNNLMVPSAHVGLHPSLVHYDITRSDGVTVGQNGQQQTAAPGGQVSYQWYAGAVEPLSVSPNGAATMQATAIEFGGFNISPADKIKQHQKGLVAAGAIMPRGSTWVEDANSRTSATVTRSDGSSFRDFTTVWQKNLNFYWADGDSVHNTEAEGGGVSEDPEDMGHMAINFGTEPMWFRFGLEPDDEDGLNGESDAHQAYSNVLAGGDPQTPVFTADAGQEVHMHLLAPASSGRKSVPTLHGHLWQRDPYVCPDSSHAGLVGKCKTSDVGSQAIGTNPVGFYTAAEQSFMASSHFEIVTKAGGAFERTGDYLFRDHMGLGNLDGLWGILRVTPAAAQ
jgi:hypothetical protein